MELSFWAFTDLVETENLFKRSVWRVAFPLVTFYGHSQLESPTAKSPTIYTILCIIYDFGDYLQLRNLCGIRTCYFVSQLICIHKLAD